MLNTRLWIARLLTGLFLGLTLQAAQALPLWTITPMMGSNPTQIVNVNSTATVQYLVHNLSNSYRQLVMKPLAGVQQTTPCFLAPDGQLGSSCILSLLIVGYALPVDGIHEGPVLCQINPNGSPSDQCYKPSNPAHFLNIFPVFGPTPIPPIPTTAIISVNPMNLSFPVNSTGTITISNNAPSKAPALNITANIPVGSNLSVQSTTCGASLAINASCTITFASNTPEGPTAVAIAGSNSNTVTANLTVTALPLISITGPEQQNRVVTVGGGQLNLQVTNDPGSQSNATAITVSNQSSCPNLVVDSSNCTSVAPGASCTLGLTSNSPYAPCLITVSGSNTTNSPTTLIAFFYLGGLVFTENNGSGQIVTDLAQEFISEWTFNPADIPAAQSSTDGVSNTNAIVVDQSCTNNPNNCAAQLCRNISSNWYLPAIAQLATIANVLCPNQAIPCNFGGFTTGEYWGSTQVNDLEAKTVFFPFGSINSGAFKTSTNRVRCIRDFP